MYFGTLAFVVSAWTIVTELCGARVIPLQNPFNDRAARASESVHEALVKAAIIPDGEYIPNGSIVGALSTLTVKVYIRVKSAHHRHDPCCV